MVEWLVTRPGSMYVHALLFPPPSYTDLCAKYFHYEVLRGNPLCLDKRIAEPLAGNQRQNKGEQQPTSLAVELEAIPPLACDAVAEADITTWHKSKRQRRQMNPHRHSAAPLPTNGWLKYSKIYLLPQKQRIQPQKKVKLTKKKKDKKKRRTWPRADTSIHGICFIPVRHDQPASMSRATSIHPPIHTLPQRETPPYRTVVRTRTSLCKIKGAWCVQRRRLASHQGRRDCAS